MRELIVALRIVADGVASEPVSVVVITLRVEGEIRPP
jgi:hypothetical protein